MTDKVITLSTFYDWESSAEVISSVIITPNENIHYRLSRFYNLLVGITNLAIHDPRVRKKYGINWRNKK